MTELDTAEYENAYLLRGEKGASRFYQKGDVL